MRVAQEEFRTHRLGPRLRLRIDLHGVSLFGPGDARTLIRWEWVEDITGGDALTVRSASAEIVLPGGVFGLTPDQLAERLLEARSLERRAEVIAELGARARPSL